MKASQRIVFRVRPHSFHVVCIDPMENPFGAVQTHFKNHFNGVGKLCPQLSSKEFVNLAQEYVRTLSMNLYRLLGYTGDSTRVVKALFKGYSNNIEEAVPILL